MSKLNVDQKNIKDLLSDKKAIFLIPDYQRPYAWRENECQTLWDDIFEFAFPGNDYSRFNPDEEYYLGPIVTFTNGNGQKEIIDGQQRLTTIMLLLRAFYNRYDNMTDPKSVETKKWIERCLWRTDEFGSPITDMIKIDSEVATDAHRSEFMEILQDGIVSDSMKSIYAENFRFFRKKIDLFLNDYPGYFTYLPMRLMNNCILLPIEAESQDTALRIFSTLNDRGKPLSDCNIFKSFLYRFYSEKGQKDIFMDRWRHLEQLCTDIFSSAQDISGMDEIFTRYMYYERALQGTRLSTTEGLRKFYSRNDYQIFRNGAFDNIIELAEFWKKVESEDSDFFSENVLRKLFVLHYAPNRMWTYLVSVYYMHHTRNGKSLEDGMFADFLERISVFILAYTLVSPGVSSMRAPLFSAMCDIVEDKPMDFAGYHFDRKNLRMIFENYGFVNSKPVTKSFLSWFLMEDKAQDVPSIFTAFDIEHIFARNRDEQENSLKDKSNLESLGNKSFLEKRINIRASDYRFMDKKKYYTGFTTSHGKKKEATTIRELLSLAVERSDFTEKDIVARNGNIFDTFITALENDSLLLPLQETSSVVDNVDSVTETAEVDVPETTTESARKRKKVFRFDMCDIPAGATLQFADDPSITVKVTNDNRRVEYEGKLWSLSAIAKHLMKTDAAISGALKFTYNGELLNDMRERMGV